MDVGYFMLVIIFECCWQNIYFLSNIRCNDNFNLMILKHTNSVIEMLLICYKLFNITETHVEISPCIDRNRRRICILLHHNQSTWWISFKCYWINIIDPGENFGFFWFRILCNFIWGHCDTMIWSFWITILGTSHQEALVEHCNLHVILKLISGHVTWSKKQMDHLVWENLCLHQTKSVAPNLDIGHRLHHRRAFKVKTQNSKNFWLTL